MTGTGAELFEELGDRAQDVEVTEIDGQSVVSRKEPLCLHSA
jgi:DNA replication and repair protein RecF